MIQIDMKMPKACIDCDLCAWVENENSFVCQPTQVCLGDIEEDDNMYSKYRHEQCPLQEVKADDVYPDTAELIEPKIPDNVTEKEPVIRVNYLKKDFGALCDTCTQTNKCRWYMLFSAYGLRYIETCDGYQNGGGKK